MGIVPNTGYLVYGSHVVALRHTSVNIWLARWEMMIWRARQIRFVSKEKSIQLNMFLIRFDGKFLAVLQDRKIGSQAPPKSEVEGGERVGLLLLRVLATTYYLLQLTMTTYDVLRLSRLRRLSTPTANPTTTATTTTTTTSLLHHYFFY